MIRRLAALAAVVALTGCSGEAADPGRQPAAPASSAVVSPTPSPPPTASPAPRPRVGSCRRLSYAAAVSPSAGRNEVPCRREHTAETFRVGDLDSVVGGHLLAVDSARIERQVSMACPRLLARFVGGTEEQRRLSMLRAVWFTPTVRQSDAGAAWFRCDAVVLAGARDLLATTGSLRGALDTATGRDRYGVCGTAEPGTRGFQRVVCDRDHTWRAIRTVGLGSGDYPGVARARSAGEDPCRAAGEAAADDPLDFQWGYEWPTADQWRAGQTWGLCWIPD
ncbi:septum formation family protein [Nocardioides coralli]|uniref:septum formation family protein n=1 Tax=Nocardioides coralli TaxID=2872154 RepID=UPI001CA4249D|nr:septum formation family protein [Nocardioides coralli]QZY30278.1 septum formation family protein [Nocardioides coralli]